MLRRISPFSFWSIALLSALGSALALGCGSQVAEPVAPAAPIETPEPVAAEAPPNQQIVIGERKVLKSAVLGEDRAYLVYVPPGYEADDATYPVIYLLDGDGHFHHASGVAAFLTDQNRMPRSIIVGIANTDRTRDLTPTHEARAETSGGGDKFLDFVETELIKTIERDYRTAPFRIIIGHSFGGLTAVHALTSRPGLFDAHIAASPSLQWDGQLMAKKTAPLFQNGTLASGFLYFTLGSEPEEITAGNLDYKKLLESAAPESFRWKFDHMKSEDHGSVVNRTIYNGLEMLFDGYRFPEKIESVAALNAHNQMIRDRFKIDNKPAEAVVNLLGYGRLLATPPNFDAAFEFFNLNVELYPKSANVYDSLGEALENAGKLEAALANYEKAVSLSDPTAEVHAIYVANRDRAAAAVKLPAK